MSEITLTDIEIEYLIRAMTWTDARRVAELMGMTEDECARLTVSLNRKLGLSPAGRLPFPAAADARRGLARGREPGDTGGGG